MAVLTFIKDLLFATLAQTGLLFGGILIFGMLFQLISHLTFKSIEKAFWSRGTYFFAWLGTPVHELGHVLFCLIFWHKITEIQLFKPDPDAGTLGYICHKWNRSNPWQVLGNVFINTGPVTLGCAVLFAIFYFLIPDSRQAWDSIVLAARGIDNYYSAGSYLEVFRASALTMLQSIFTIPNLLGWRFWLFVYLSICVASNMRLSMLDIKGSLSGLGWLVLVFVLINILGLLIGLFGDVFSQSILLAVGLIYSLMILALVMGLIGFILVYLVASAWVRIKYKHALNPF